MNDSPNHSCADRGNFFDRLEFSGAEGLTHWGGHDSRILQGMKYETGQFEDPRLGRGRARVAKSGYLVRVPFEQEIGEADSGNRVRLFSYGPLSSPRR